MDVFSTSSRARIFQVAFAVFEHLWSLKHLLWQMPAKNIFFALFSKFRFVSILSKMCFARGARAPFKGQTVDRKYMTQPENINSV